MYAWATTPTSTINIAMNKWSRTTMDKLTNALLDVTSYAWATVVRPNHVGPYQIDESLFIRRKVCHLHA